MTDPMTGAPRDFAEIFDAMTLRLEKAAEITKLAFKTESEFSTVFAVIREQIEFAQALAGQLWESRKGPL